MPSLHAAYPMLICLFFWSRANRWFRALLVAYVLAMAFTLVYTGEHFVIDEFVGWSYAAAAYFVGSHLLDRWTAWRSDRLASPGSIRAAIATEPMSSVATHSRER